MITGKPILNTSNLMLQVIYGLILGVALQFYFFGWGVIYQITLALITGIAAEIIFLKIRKKSIDAIKDNSAALTAILLAISIPSIAPWWIVVLGTSFAIIFGKQLYGGLGSNPLNPAMLGYAFLLISFPLEMTRWTSSFLSFGEGLNVIFSSINIDALSSATRLEEAKFALMEGEVSNPIQIDRTVWINLGFLFGGVYLFYKKVITWRIPLSFLAGIIVMSLLLMLIDSDHAMGPVFHLFHGATMLGAFFILTDPVSSSTTPRGRLIFGFLIGILVIIIRTYGSYPDGVAFAVLLLNIAVPLIDYYSKPKVFGR
ncbi:RnfABCDGE type electron transport complex subunit D [Gammaproteobacteria bacterium]|nr:RnfABCDGE type electron transport complex subunit D [Gammaproteobacteria bacterium]